MFAPLFHASPIAMILTSLPEGVYVEVNPAAEHLFGYRRDELVGRAMTDVAAVFTPPDQAQMRALLAAHGRIAAFACRITSGAGIRTACLVYGETLELDGARYLLTQVVAVSPQDPPPPDLPDAENTRFADARVHATFDLMLEGAQIIGYDWQYRYLNAAAQRHNNRPNQELLGQHYADAWPGIAATPVFALIRQCLEERHASQLENQFVFPDGRVGWFELRIQPIPEGALILSVDITERKQAELALREREATLKALLDATPDAMLVVNPAGQIIMVNAQAEPLFGYPQAEILGMPIEQLIPERFRPRHMGYRATFGAHASPRTMSASRELYALRKDGRECPVEISLSQHTIGSDVMVISTIRDITTRKRAEEQLRQSEERYRYLFAHNPHPMWAYDRTTLRFLAVNDVAVARYGYTRDEFLAMTIADIRPPEDVERLQQDLLQQRPPIQQTEGWRHQWKDGTVIDVEISSHTFTLAGRDAVLVVAQDVTARMQAEAARRESETRFVTIFDHSPVAIGIARLSDHQITEVNAAFLAITGYARDAVIGRTTDELGVWARPDDRLRMLDTLGTHQQVSDFETILHPVTGDDRAVLLSGEIVAINGEAHMLIQIIDITERRLAELALRAREEQYRGLMESLDNVVFTVDAAGTLLYMNTVAAQQLGGSPQDMLGKTIAELYPPDIVAPHLDDIRRVIADDQRIVVELLLLPQAQPRWYRTSLQPLHDTTGRVVAVLVNATDIHDLKLVEQALQDLNQTLEERVRQRTAEVHDLYEHAPTGYHSLDPDGMVLMVNQTALSWLGYPRDALIGRPITAFLTPASQATFQATFAPFKRRGWAHNVEVEFIRSDGTIFPALINATAIYDSSGTYVMSRSTVFDHTELKKAENALRLANAELAQAAQAKDAFLANMSHELRTPLNAILAFSEVLLETVYGPLTPRQQAAISTIESSGRHLLALINDILDLAKVEAGRLDIQLEPVSVADVCQASLQFVKEQALRKSLTLDLRLDAEVTTVLVDVKRLKQMLVNLLSNAVKFTPDKGEVTLTVSRDPVANMMCFAVQDSGIGIAPEDLGRLFQPFVQLDSLLSRQHEGTGLGLALVRRLAELHGGSVIVTSELGVGSCFTISLPHHQPEANDDLPALAVRDSNPRGVGSLRTALVVEEEPAGGRILLVDDTASNIGALDEYLRAKAYEVVVAHTGQEALDQVGVVRPDIILMDIQMPEMDGLEAIRRLRAMPDYAATPIIALTALAMRGDRERCLAAGATAYLTKPVSLKGLVELIAQLIHA